jgi:alkylhydroperoxidase/carboxymuconolactone decarboxylase family protein YurZ
MRKFGYKMMSGSWLGSNGSHPAFRAKRDASAQSSQSLVDPYNSMMTRLKNDVFFGPGTLDATLRQAAGSGDEIPGALGPYVRMVAKRDYQGIDKSMVDLRLEGYSDDQIFEATVSAALGAGNRRLKMALDALRHSHNMSIDLP